MFCGSIRLAGLCLIAIMMAIQPMAVSAASKNVIDASSAPVESGLDKSDVIVLKRKVAIARFTNETQSRSSFLVDDSGDRMGKQAADILSARLTTTNKFLMFERIDAGKTSSEQIIAGLQEDGIAVDYLIVGSVSEFGRSTESDRGVFSRSKTQKAYAKVNVRLVDVATGRIIFAAEGAGEASTEAKRVMGVGSDAGYDQSLTDKSISAAISELVSNLVEEMTSKPWRSYVLAMEDGFYIISGGESQGLKPGTTLYVYSNGRRIKNPQTGGMITLPGKNVGTLTVVASAGDDEFSEISFTELSSGSISRALENYYVSDK